MSQPSTSKRVDHGRTGGRGNRRQLDPAAIEARRAARAAAVPAITYPAELPVTAHRDEIEQAIRDHQVVIVAGETGSGKTTQLPKICLDLGRGVDAMIGHTQPRRIAARTVAERIADELGVPLGGAVGYAVRFTDVVSESTLVKVMTDGILLAEIRRDKMLRAYDTIIVDEAHERSLNIDFLLGYLTQLLPKRPDLKVCITSATIDTERFATHFAAPVIEVSGRTYPVEIRYRPLEPVARDPGARDTGARDTGARDTGARDPGARDTGAAEDAEDRDPTQALCDAVAELVADGPGDVLVFLPGERDIRDAAEALSNSGPPGIEIVPLYARLSAAEQHRVFRPHSTRRVVLATNVAETSLTVPGIRSVVDTGLARISRFSHRTKVQRLPIERVSKASADQRAGRCGRVAPGTCIRLYSQDDYEARPDFTDPEILRTNLASVILQMAAVGLGEIEHFPFLEPPDRRSIADGRALLEELGALEATSTHTPASPGDRFRITPLGRRIAELPLDPRLGRMVVEAERLGCLREVTIIAAALAVADPRERPSDKAQAADELHRRFLVPESDFLGFVALWDYLVEIQRELSGNQFRRRCRAEYLSVLRVREWQDVASQIRRTTRSAGLHANTEPAPADHVHQALLTGLLSQIGMRDKVRSDYQGARGTRFVIGRGSALARRTPAWVMAGELVETERTYARVLARIEPAWAERAAAHLVRRSHGEPWWDASRGEAMVDERVTLYGLPVVARRPISLARIDPGIARELFILHALVEQDWPVHTEPIKRHAARVERIRAIEQRVRRANLLVADEVIAELYDDRLPQDITNGKRFLRWWKEVGTSQPDILDLPYSSLLDTRDGPVDLAGYPIRWVVGRETSAVVGRDYLEFPLSYRWEPGAEDDGITAVIPLVALNQVSDHEFDWLVPGFRPELVTALVRTLPKSTRRNLSPIAESVQTILATTGPIDGPLLPALARRITAMTGDAVRFDPWDLEALPSHLRVRLHVVDDHGKVLAIGRDLAQLRAALIDELREALARAAPDLERHAMQHWDCGDLPQKVERAGAFGYPALVDEGSGVGVAVLDSPEAQHASMWAGTQRLLHISAAPAKAHVERRLTRDTKLVLARIAEPLAALLDDCTTAAINEIIDRYGGPTYSAAGFAVLAEDARTTLGNRVAHLANVAAALLATVTHLRLRLDGLESSTRASDAVARAVADMRSQLDALVPGGFVARHGAARLAEMPRYLEAVDRRISALPADARRDAERLETVTRVCERYERVAGVLSRAAAPSRAHGQTDDDVIALGPTVMDPAPGESVRWMIEELRVSLWAQSLGTPAPISEARIVRTIESILTAVSVNM